MVGTATGSPYHSIEVLLVYGLVAGILIRNSKRLVHATKAHLYIFLLPLWAIASSVWSQEPFTSLNNALSVMIVAFLGLYLIDRFSPVERIDLLLLLGGVALVGSLAVIIVYPEAGIYRADNNGAWDGLFDHKNHCAVGMAYMVVPFFYSNTKAGLHKVILTLYFVGTVLLIAMTQARTGWLLLVISLVLVGFLHLIGKFGGQEKLVLLMVSITVAGLIAYGMLTHAEQIALALGKDATLTGRTGIWAAIWPSLWAKPWLGSGYVAFWTGLKGDSAPVLLTTGYLNLGNAENPMLQIWLELGLVGVVLMLAALIHASWNAVKCVMHRPSRFICWCITVVFMTMVALLDGDKIFYPHTLQWLLFVVADVSLCEEVRKRRMENIA